MKELSPIQNLVVSSVDDRRRNPEIRVMVDSGSSPASFHAPTVNEELDEIDEQKRRNRLAAERMTTENIPDMVTEGIRNLGLSPTVESSQPESMLLQEYYDRMKANGTLSASLPNLRPYSPPGGDLYANSLKQNQPCSLPEYVHHLPDNGNSQMENTSETSVQNRMESIGKKPSVEKDVGLGQCLENDISRVACDESESFASDNSSSTISHSSSGGVHATTSGIQIPGTCRICPVIQGCGGCARESHFH